VNCTELGLGLNVGDLSLSLSRFMGVERSLRSGLDFEIGGSISGRALVVTFGVGSGPILRNVNEEADCRLFGTRDDTPILRDGDLVSLCGRDKAISTLCLALGL
jgi:hypothetical protein